MVRITKKLFPILILLLSIGKLNAQKDTLKVMTYNVWNGFEWGKALDRKANLINWVVSKDPDVLALQELNAYTQEKLEADAKKWGHSYAQLLKENGYSVGLTSKSPIKLKDKVNDGMWHGLLHCKTYDIDFFVVHLSPSDYAFRKKEADIIADKIKNSRTDKFIVLGDFNAHSPSDADYMSQKKSLLSKYLKANQRLDNKYSNTVNGQFDFSVMSKFLSIPTVDVVQPYVNIEKRYSFPAMAVYKGNIPIDASEKKERIDFILASLAISKYSINGTIYNSADTNSLSDHFPVEATFLIPKK